MKIKNMFPQTGLFAGILSILWIAFPCVTQAALLRKCFNKITTRDTLCTVWVLFSDKAGGGDTNLLSPHALARRARAGFASSSASDIPVLKKYITEIEQMGGHCRNVFKWANAASFSISASKLKALAAMAFVKDIIPLRTFSRRFPKGQIQVKNSLKKSLAADTSSLYGQAFSQLNIVAVPSAHRAIASQLNKAPGEGVIIGMFDSGFRLNHRCFNYVKIHQGFIADSDFVEHDGDVSDPDSVRRIYHALDQSPPEEHGSLTLALIAGIDSGRFAGAAWGAKFVLAKTEWADRILKTSTGNDTIVDIEMHSEEDNWAAAMVWAESLGVDIVSCSLGYSTDFTDSLGNPRPQDDITFSDLNGTTTIISKAATEAAARGMIIVNAVGNEGPLSGTLDAPADVEDVISVGGIWPDKSLAGFSSRGPAADGRIKPDLVAQAIDIYVPDIYSPDSADYESGPAGTSFSTPIVAGICALIRQTHPLDSAAQLRERLYSSCVFAPGQTAVDNNFGRGIPNAFVACQVPAPIPPQASEFILYPNVLDLFHKRNQHLFVKFLAATDDPINYSQVLKVAIRTVAGNLVWSHSEICTENTPVSLTWPESDKLYSPGTYYFIITYRGKSYSKKFLILG
jgi:Subtilisin-like serine proteases